MLISSHSCLLLLDRCSTLLQLKQAHAQLITLGLARHAIAAGRVVAVCALSCFPGGLDYAYSVFNDCRMPNSFMWNHLIRAHVQLKDHDRALLLFNSMRRRGFRPDQHTFPFAIQACFSQSMLRIGMALQGCVVSAGYERDVYVVNALVGMYGGCGIVGAARQVFDETPERDLPLWNIMIRAYVSSGSVCMARKLFDEMPERNVISWSCMIDGCVRHGLYKEALGLFHEMLVMEEAKPNEITLSSVLSACGRLGALEHGEWVHAYIGKCGMKIDVVLGTSLIDMYAKCGSIERAHSVFCGLKCRDVMTWSAMISGLAMHGHDGKCLQLFSLMQREGVRPNAVTFVGVLCACGHVGLVDEGRHYFNSMWEEFGISPLIQHYGCMVDLYSRAGLMEKAYEVIKNMPIEPDVLIWGSLLSGCRTSGNIEMAELASRKVIELDPLNSGAYVLLSNIYAKSGRWDDVKSIRRVMEEKGINKTPGCSLVELDGVVYEFFAGDESNPISMEIHSMLEEIMRRLRMIGYVENTAEVALNLNEEGKEHALLVHSEKLAVAFCFISTPPRTPIRIVKNLRICVDCHLAFKLMSREFDRAIVIRDCNRFHHFKDGSCSCRDYW
ncbi:Pentatricopeptide repeat-containing protein [Nymphaea thermarum]|nr:Pentatricopeptide repeat-containing protein [Nymphaea thermarum]